VYVSLPASAGEPPQRLVGFEKVWLDAGQARRVRVVIDPRAASHPLGTWDARSQSWTVPNGAFRVRVSRSAADVALADSVIVR
jgi:beta-glucosidase